MDGCMDKIASVLKKSGTNYFRNKLVSDKVTANIPIVCPMYA